jgi:hypothetical protein
MQLGLTTNVTLSLLHSTLSPVLEIPLYVAESGIISIPSMCQLNGSNPPSCSFTIKAIGIGSTVINAGAGSIKNAQLGVTVTN